jgi:hypothetical protein
MGELCDLFTNVYFETINPKTNYNRLLSIDVLSSIIFHVIFYILIIFSISYLFNFKIDKKTYIKITIFLLIIMVLGYFGRLSRVKSIYNYFINKGFSEKDSLTSSVNILHNGYFTYYFLG